MVAVSMLSDDRDVVVLIHADKRGHAGIVGSATKNGSDCQTRCRRGRRSYPVLQQYGYQYTNYCTCYDEE